METAGRRRGRGARIARAALAVLALLVLRLVSSPPRSIPAALGENASTTASGTGDSALDGPIRFDGTEAVTAQETSIEVRRIRRVRIDDTALGVVGLLAVALVLATATGSRRRDPDLARPYADRDVVVRAGRGPPIAVV